MTSPRNNHRSDDTGLTIRRAGDRDRMAIEILAERDSAEAPSGEILLAEAGGHPLAALSLDDGSAVADPFAVSGEALALLRTRRRQLRRRERRAARLSGGAAGAHHGRGALAGSPPGAGGRLLVLPPR